ncbi:MAG: potassium-transporting ATPase subunit KdpA, partial [Rubrivivax sp.]
MSAHAGWLLAVFALALLAVAVPLGRYLAGVFDADSTRPFWASRLLGPVEGGLYRLCGVRADEEQHWLRYTLGLLLFNALGVIALYAV